MSDARRRWRSGGRAPSSYGALRAFFVRRAVLLLIGASGCAPSVEVVPSPPCPGCCDSAYPTPEHCAEPPGPGPETPVDGPGATLAIRRLFFGDIRRDGTADVNAWRSFGLDLDHSASAPDSSSGCIPPGGDYSEAANEDGHAGRDNAFGSALLPMLFLPGGFLKNANEMIEQGLPTTLIAIQGIGAGPEYNPVSARVYAGARLTGALGEQVAPKWDGTDEWPVLDGSVVDGSIDAPVLVFPNSYVVTDASSGARWWVSGPPDPANALKVAVPPLGLLFTIHAPLLTVELASDNAWGKNGTIAGVLDPAEVVCQIELLASMFDPDLYCWDDPPDSIPTEEPMIHIPGACDIGLPSGPDPKGTCNGISIGLGFEARAVKLGPVVPEPEPPSDSCGCY